MRVCCRCGNVAAILELDEHLQKNFTIFEAAPQVSSFCHSYMWLDRLSFAETKVFDHVSDTKRLSSVLANADVFLCFRDLLISRADLLLGAFGFGSWQ